MESREPNHMQPYLPERLRKENKYPDVPLADHHEQIRLMRLLPAEQSAPISCEIFKVTLADFKHSNGQTKDVACNSRAAVSGYEAVSYVWGSFSNKVIGLNGNEGFLITDNLAAALRRLRNAQEPRVLWVDAICIDQNNTAERNAQVGIMRDIFAHASRVIVWLGEPPLGTVPGLAYSPWSMVFSLVIHGDLVWWRRMWTVQEAAVAHELCVRYGEVEMPWSTFVKIFSNLPDVLLTGNKPLQPTPRKGSDVGAYIGSYNMDEALAIARSSLSAIEHLQGDGVPDRGLRHWLLMTEKRYATDARDKIFGILGLVAQSSLDQGLVLVPDYSKSIGDVFSEAVCSIAQQQGSLDILTEGWPHNVELYPWTTDFSVTRRKRGDSFHGRRHGTARAVDPYYSPLEFKASSSSEPKITVLKNDGLLIASTQNEKSSRSVLSIGGFAVGKICAVSERVITLSEGRVMSPRQYGAGFTAMIEALTTMWNTANAKRARCASSSTLTFRLSRFRHYYQAKVAHWRALRALLFHVLLPYVLAISLKDCFEARIQLLSVFEAQQYGRETTAPHWAATIGQTLPRSTGTQRRGQLSDTYSLRLDLGEAEGDSCILVAEPKRVSEGYHFDLAPRRFNLDDCLGNLGGHFDPYGRSWIPGSTNMRLEGGSVLSATLHWQLCTRKTGSRKATIDLNNIFKDLGNGEVVSIRTFLSIPESYSGWEALFGTFGRGCMQEPDLSNPLLDSDRMRQPHGSSHHCLSCEPHLPDHGKATFCESDCVDPNMVLLRRSLMEGTLAASPREAMSRSMLSSHLESLVMQTGPKLAPMLDRAFAILDAGSNYLAAKDTASAAYNVKNSIVTDSTGFFVFSLPDSHGDGKYHTIEKYKQEYRQLQKTLDILAESDFPYTVAEMLGMTADFDHLFADRKPFCTTTGLLGFGPMDTQVGDEVAVALGAKTPYVLRTHGQFTHLVGDAYVDGIMHGEMVKLHEQYPDEYPIVDLVKAPEHR